jgi:hypothetical protein
LLPSVAHIRCAQLWTLDELSDRLLPLTSRFSAVTARVLAPAADMRVYRPDLARLRSAERAADALRPVLAAAAAPFHPVHIRQRVRLPPPPRSCAQTGF